MKSRGVGMVDAFIGIGSNLGNREENVRKAIELLASAGRVVATSSMYETEPMYLENQGLFINCVAKLNTDLEPTELLKKLKGFESELGRKKGQRYGPRIIDLDILFYGSQVVARDDLAIPHPKIQERSFVLVPLTEIEPGLVHPVIGKTVSQLLRELGPDKKVRRAAR